MGKSSILNHLANRKAAIVSATPGTTRDAIEVNLDIGGYKVGCCDYIANTYSRPILHRMSSISILSSVNCVDNALLPEYALSLKDLQANQWCKSCQSVV